MRTWQHIGFNFRGLKFIAENVVAREVIRIDDVWFGEGPEIEKMVCRDGSVVYSFVQMCPWSSGPMTYMALTDAAGTPIYDTLWYDGEPVILVTHLVKIDL